MPAHMRWLAQRIWMQQFSVLVIKEFRQLVRDRAVFAYIVYIFTLNIIIAAGGPSMELHGARLVIHDGDRSTASRELIHRLQAPWFDTLGRVDHPDEGLRLLDRGEALVLLDIPPHFGENLTTGEHPADVQILVDTSQSYTGYLASSYTARIAASFGREWASRHGRGAAVSAAGLPIIENQRRFRFNPTLNDTWFYAVSELLSMLTVACIFLPAVAAVREKERGTLEQLLVSPLSPFQILVSKVFAMLIVAVLGASVSLLLIIYPLFSVPIRGDLGLFFLLTALYAFAASGLGLLAASFVRNSGQVGMILLLLLMPIIMLSGIWTRLESMPDWLSAVVLFSPLRYFVEIAYGILIRGAGLELLWRPIVALLVLGTVLSAIALLRFRRRPG